MLVRHVRVAVTFAALAFVFVPSLAAQTDPAPGAQRGSAAQRGPAMVLFDGPAACLSSDEVSELTNVIGDGELPSGVARRQPLDIVVAAYRCMLDSRAADRTSSGFRSEFVDALHGLYEDRELCLYDRLSAALITLRDVANRLVSSPPDVLSQREIQWVYEALSDSRTSIERASEIHRRFGSDPNDPVLLRLARTSCVEPSDPVPAEVYLREFVDASVALGGHHRGVGRDAGAVLASILPGTMEMLGWAESEDPFRNPSSLYRDWSVLVSVDEANLSSTGPFLEVVKQLEGLERTRSIVPEQVTPRTTRPEFEQMRATLRLASDRLIRSEEAWKYYDHYSDVLFRFSEAYALRRDPAMYRLVVDEAGGAAWEGFERVAGLATDDGLGDSQQKLMDRVASYGMEFAEQLDYTSLVEFESQFVDVSGRIVPSEFQCHVNAHLAQAKYVLGVRSPDASREYPSHLEESCRLLTAGDLENLRVAVQEIVQ